MVLIFEGADLVGKTTLARHYARRLGYPIVKIRWDLKDTEAETVAFAKTTIGLLSAIDANVILDRSFMSMWAYEEDSAYMEPLIRALRYVRSARIVVLTTDPQVLKERYESRPDGYFSSAQVLAANARFTQLPQLIPQEVTTLQLDTGRLTIEQCCAEVDRMLDIAAEAPPAVDTAGFVEVRIPIGDIPVDVAFPR